MWGRRRRRRGDGVARRGQVVARRAEIVARGLFIPTDLPRSSPHPAGPSGDIWPGGRTGRAALPCTAGRVCTPCAACGHHGAVAPGGERVGRGEPPIGGGTGAVAAAPARGGRGG